MPSQCEHMGSSHRVARPHNANMACLRSPLGGAASGLLWLVFRARGSGLGPVSPGRMYENSPLRHCRYVYDHSGRKYGGKLPMVGFMTEWVRSKGHGFKSQVCRTSFRNVGLLSALGLMGAVLQHLRP